MKVKELLALEPKLEVYELNPEGRYLVCIDGALVPQQNLHNFARILKQNAEANGVKIVGILDRVPRIFEMEPEEDHRS